MIVVRNNQVMGIARAGDIQKHGLWKASLMHKREDNVV